MLRGLLLITLACAFLSCFHEGGDTEVAPAEEIDDTSSLEMAEELAVIYPCPIEDRGDWIFLVELPRRNLNPDTFRMVDEWIDPITQAYVDGKDFLFVIYKPSQPGPNGRPIGGNIVQARYYLEAPGLLYGNTLAQKFHFVDPNAQWFTNWDRTGRDRTQSGFTVRFNATPMFEPSVPGVVKSREYLYGPEFGTSLDGVFVGGGGAPEIKTDWVLRIYTR